MDTRYILPQRKEGPVSYDHRRQQNDETDESRFRLVRHQVSNDVIRVSDLINIDVVFKVDIILIASADISFLFALGL